MMMNWKGHYIWLTIIFNWKYFSVRGNNEIVDSNLFNFFSVYFHIFRYISPELELEWVVVGKQHIVALFEVEKSVGRLHNTLFKLNSIWIKMHLLKKKHIKCLQFQFMLASFIWWSSIDQKKRWFSQIWCAVCTVYFYCLISTKKNPYQKGKERTNSLIECHYNWVVWMNIS